MSEDLNKVRDALKNFTQGVKDKEMVKDRQSFINSISQEVIKVFSPLFKEMASNVRMNKEEMKAVGESIASRISVPEIRVPDINIPAFPEVRVPEPRVTVNLPQIKIPDIVMPEEMAIRGWVQLQGVSLENPLPVQLRDASGKPVSLGEGMMMGGTGGGGFRHVKVDTNTGDPLYVAIVSGAGGATSGVNVLDSSGVAYTGSNPVPVYITSGGSATSASALVDSTGIQYSGSNPLPISWVSGAGVSTAVTIQDSSGVGYSGSNPVPITLVSGGLTSTIVVGSVVGDAVDDGSAPVQSGGIARTANPTAVAANDVVKSTYDDLGRQLVRPVQVRDLTVTAYASIANGTETTLLAASAGSFHDLVYLIAANNSDAAVTLDVRPVTAGNIIMTIQVPANGTAGISTPVPLPQSASDTGNNWTIGMADITGTTVYVTGLFSREV